MILQGTALLLGANWNNGANAGAFALNLNNDASNANSNIGGRLASIPLARSKDCTAVLSNALYLGAVSFLYEENINKRARQVRGKATA